MKPEILAIFIPIIFLIGLFTAISLNIYFKYKARIVTADHAPGESTAEWYEAEARAKASVSRTAALCLGAFLTGAGIGTVLGIFIGGSDSVWQFFGSFSECHEIRTGLQISIYAYFIMACAMFVGGGGMLCAWFFERKLDGKKYKQLNK